MTDNNIDQKLWKMAEDRVELYSHIKGFFLFNIVMWAIWYFTTDDHDVLHAWVLYVTGISLLSALLQRFRGHPLSKEERIRQEYEKIRDR